MFQDYNYNSSMVQVTSLKIHSGNGGINRPVFKLKSLTHFSGALPSDTLRKWQYQRTCILS